MAPASLYPVEMIRALAMVWLFGGLRSDEISSRLRVGAIRWKEAAPEGGGSWPPGASLPVGRAGEQNQRGIRQTRRSDGGRSHRSCGRRSGRSNPRSRIAKQVTWSTSSLSTRARPLGERYLNRMLIPWLCKKAGVPREDAPWPGSPATAGDPRLHPSSITRNSLFHCSSYRRGWDIGRRTPRSTTPKSRPRNYPRPTTRPVTSERNLPLDQRTHRSGRRPETPAGRQRLEVLRTWAMATAPTDFFDQCQHRMACAKCSFYTPKSSTAALLLWKVKTNLLRMRQEIPLLEQTGHRCMASARWTSTLKEVSGPSPTPEGPTPRELQTRPLPVQIQASRKKGAGK